MTRIIDADKAVDRIAELIEQEWGYEGIKEDVKKIFDEQPTVDAEPVRHGKWIKTGSFTCECSECNHRTVESYANYCPNCGADMRERIKESD